MEKPVQRYLINIHYLELGGAETALIGLLHSLDPQKVKVDLMVNDPRGELMKYVPNWVNLLPVPKSYRYIERPLSEAVRSGQLGVTLGRIMAKIAYWRYCRKTKPKEGSAIFGYIGRYVTPFLPPIKSAHEYDVAVSFLTPHDIVAEKVKAKRRLCWIHTDYSRIDVNPVLEQPVWARYDRIVSISPDVTASFVKIFPELRDKIVEIENFLPLDLIRSRAEEFVPEEFSYPGMKLLTIGRFCHAKRIEEIPDIAAELLKAGIDFTWYLIGYGPESERDKILSKIAGLKLADRVIMLGKRENPYPYIKNCDIYVQPSRFEGKSITVQEAQILGVPLVITDYPSARSQIKDGTDGFIGPYDTTAFGKFLAGLLKNSGKLNSVRNKLAEKNFTQYENLGKFEALFV